MINLSQEWNPNWEEYKGSNMLLYLASINLDAALSEREQAIGYYPTRPHYATTIGNDFFKKFQRSIDYVIPRYVNHTIQDGDFSGLTEFPMWTEADILEAISDEERLPIPNEPMMSAKWCYQQYKIINVLRWRSLSFEHDWTVIGLYYKWKKTGEASTWGETVSRFNDATWQLEQYSPYEEYVTQYHEDSDFYTIRGRKWEWYAKVEQPFDIYVTPTAHNESSIFAPIGNNTTQDVLQYQYSMPANSGNYAFPLYDDAFYDNAIPKPDSYTYIGQIIPTAGKFLIAKHDGDEQGFSFRDW